MYLGPCPAADLYVFYIFKVIFRNAQITIILQFLCNLIGSFIGHETYSEMSDLDQTLHVESYRVNLEF